MDHAPVATLSILAANCVIFFLSASGVIGEEAFERWWILPHGSIDPIHWFTSVFAHGDFLHLAGNMIFLWTFGMIIEGKIGWRVFLLVYLFIAGAEGLVEQLLMLGSADPDGLDALLPGPSGSLGASSVLMGLVAMSMIWAPRNELDCALFVSIRPYLFTAKISTMAGFFVLWDLGFAALAGFEMGTSLLHVLGVAVGLPLGILFVKQGWVDCEGWDLLTIRRYGRPRRDLAEAEAARLKKKRQRRTGIRRIRRP